MAGKVSVEHYIEKFSSLNTASQHGVDKTSD